MLFVIYCIDKPGHGEVRAGTRPAHLNYLDGFKDQLVMAGPTLSEDGAGMTGSLLIMDFPDLAAAKDFAANDPYAKAGLFESVDVKPWKKVLPAA